MKDCLTALTVSENQKYIGGMAWNPAHKIVMRLGGEKAVADILGCSLTTPYTWQYPRERGGTNGRIPARHIPTLMSAAKERGKRLRFEDFFAEPNEVAE